MSTSRPRQRQRRQPSDTHRHRQHARPQNVGVGTRTRRTLLTNGHAIIVADDDNRECLILATTPTYGTA